VALVFRSIAALSIVLASLLVGGERADANHAWSTYHWARTANPFTLKLAGNTQPSGNDSTGTWSSILGLASADWSRSTVMDTTIVASSGTKRCRPTTGIVTVCNDTYGFNGWLGLAQIWLSGSHITQGVSKMNDSYFNAPTYNISTEKRHVMCQEVGHTFGLGHQDESGASLNTCMDYYRNTSSTDTKSTTPNQHDYDELVIIYSHLDSSTTIGAAAPKGAGASEGDPGFGEDGTPKGASKDKGKVYVTDLGGGKRIVTFIFWTH